MGRLGKISTIKKEFNNSSVQTLESGLSQKGLTRVPGTIVYKYPHKELDGQYRTGLNPDASYIKRIADPTERELEIERVTKLKNKLQEALGDIDLGPRSKFWNYGLANYNQDNQYVTVAKLIDGDNYFDFSIPLQELTFAWLRVHPSIASSFQAWERGEFPSNTQFYVVDEDIESEIIYKKKNLVNKAIYKFQELGPEKRKKIARLLGLPVTENTKEEVVYNQIDTILKQTEFKTGIYQGLNPVEIFNRFVDMSDSLLTVKDLVKQAIIHSIYRAKATGKLYEGEFEIATSEEELVKHLMDENNQDDLIMLEQKLKAKKVAAT